jgi:hypothetical protein
MPSLRDLKAKFLRHETRQEISWDKRTPGGLRTYLVPTETLAEAHGVSFLCTLCFQANGGSVGTHSVICWFRGRVPDDVPPGPGRWTPAGDTLDTLSFVPGDPPLAHSVLLLGGCNWHGFVVNGSAQ